MARRLDHARAAARDRMRDHGIDNLADPGLSGGLTPPRARPSKADLRAQIQEATARITRIVRCGCGHQAAVTLPPSRLHAKLRCSKCGSVLT